MFSVDVIYVQAQEEKGEEIISWIERESIGEKSSELLRTESGFFKQSFMGSQDVAMNSVIVVVSDEATEVQEWKDYLNGLDNSVRVITVGRTVNADYSNVDVVPQAIHGINYIRYGEAQFKNILDALTTNPELYSIKNFLLSRYFIWKSGSDTALLTSFRSIRKYKKMINKRLAVENDIYFRDQLENIRDYLNASNSYVLKQNFNLLTDSFKNLSMAFALVVFIIALSVFIPMIKRAYLGTALLSVDSLGDPQIAAFKMTEIMTNPIAGSKASNIAFSRMLECLDSVWGMTPIGMNYCYEIEDIAIPDGTKYLWSCDSGGNVICWDMTTGEKAESYIPGEKEETLCSIGIYKDSKAVFSEKGCLYYCRNGNWEKENIQSKVEPFNSHILITENTLLLYDETILEKYEISDGGLNQITVIEEDGIFCANLSEENDEVLYAFEKNSKLWIGNLAGNTVNKSESNVEVGQHSIADVNYGQVICTDVSGQVWLVKEGKETKKGLVLDQPIALSFINEDTVVYHERDYGSGIYDIREEFDYGDILGEYGAVRKISSTEELIVFQLFGYYQAVAIEDYLKKESIPKNEVAETVFCEKECSVSPSVEMNYVREASIQENGVINLVSIYGNEEADILLDPALVLHNHSGHFSEEDTAILDGDVAYLEQEPFMSKGRPSVVGIRIVPANETVDEDYTYLLVGCEDGRFAELSISSVTGKVIKVSEHLVPSRSPIKSIYVVQDNYYLEDEAGNFWLTPSRVNTVYIGGVIDAVAQKKQSGVNKDMKKVVSPKLWKRLDLHIYPGGDGKEWK